MWREQCQTEYDSQLITLANAYYNLTNVSVSDQKYKELLDKCNGYSSKIDTAPAFKELGLEVEEQLEIHTIRQLATWKFYEGFHKNKNDISASIGIMKLQIGSVRIFNYDPASRYVFGDDFIEILRLHEKDIPLWNVRSFKLK